MIIETFLIKHWRGMAVSAIVAITALALWGGIERWNSSRKDAAFDAARQTEADQRAKEAEHTQQLAVDRDAAINQAKAAEQQAAAAEARLANARVVRQRADQRLQQTNQDLTVENQRYAEQLKNLSGDASDPCTRWLRTCAKAIQLGIRAANEPCSCASR